VNSATAPSQPISGIGPPNAGWAMIAWMTPVNSPTTRRMTLKK
jgi:hypothetical protein